MWYRKRTSVLIRACSSTWTQSLPPSPRLDAFGFGFRLCGFPIHKHHRRAGLHARIVLQQFGSLLVQNLLTALLVIAAWICGRTVEDEVLGDPQDQVEPEEVDCLQRGEQSKRDVLADPAFVLLRFPVQLEWADRPEFGQGGPEDAQVDVMA